MLHTASVLIPRSTAQIICSAIGVSLKITVSVKDEIGAIGKLSEIFVENKVNINHIGVYSFEDGIANLVIRCDTTDPDDLQADLERKGYKVLECFVRDK